jgi:hypothetical protein
MRKPRQQPERARPMQSIKVKHLARQPEISPSNRRDGRRKSGSQRVENARSDTKTGTACPARGLSTQKQMATT